MLEQVTERAVWSVALPTYTKGAQAFKKNVRHYEHSIAEVPTPAHDA